MKKLLLIGVVLIVGAWGWYLLQLRPLDGSADAIHMIAIPKGTSVRGIGELLEDQGIIRSSTAFRIRARRRGDDGGLQAGSFALSPAMDVDSILDALVGASAQQMKLTIPEGFTVKDIDRLVASKGLAATGAILECAQTCDFSSFTFVPKGKTLASRGGMLEGYLYPDTYFVSTADFVPKFFLERLLSTFRERVIVTFEAQKQTTKRTWHEIVTMASLIEEETRAQAERPVVSGILWKRFDANQGLAVDAALRYILEKPSAAITKDDLLADTPYNLRRYRGLPPGPIANSGIGSVKAALQPEPSPYWYYLHGKDGQIRYAETNDEHNLNKAKYLH